MKRKFNFFCFWLLLALSAATLVFNSCSKDDSGNSSTSGKGVVINGVAWATCNVDKPGTFAAKPEDAGMFYQWNRKIGWATTGNVTGWDNSIPTGNAWTKSNDPSPTGWRVPTLKEIQKLCDDSKVSNEWTIQNGINGVKFTDIATGNSIFLPAAGMREQGYSYDVGFGGYYWSNTADDTNGAWFLLLQSSLVGEDGYTRDDGCCVRPVAE